MVSYEYYEAEMWGPTTVGRGLAEVWGLASLGGRGRTRGEEATREEGTTS